MNYEILDVTLRDGSYEVDFRFSEADVAAVGGALEKAGVKYVEIGHGQGLDASSEKLGIAKCTDEAYLDAAQQALRHIAYGMFCIPGIAKLESLDLLAKYGAKFVRIGCNTDIKDVERTEAYIRRAKELGLMVFSNYMKTYVADDREFEACIKLSSSYGADCLVIVDSAGCMFPEDIQHYYNIIRNTCGNNVKVGFHGHDNLGLSVSNSLYALQIGCDIVDSSLQSLGRGAGNASTEQLIAILQKKFGYDGYRLAPLMHFSEDYLRHMVKFKGVSGLDTYCGIAGFHSGYMNSVRKLVAQYGVDPYDLIIDYCKIDRIGMDEAVLERLAKEIAQ